MKIKQDPRDFEVEEVLHHPRAEGGEHGVYLLEKRSRNTLEVLSELARRAGVGRDAHLAHRPFQLPRGGAGEAQYR